jgi:hypothetical protein
VPTRRRPGPSPATIVAIVLAALLAVGAVTLFALTRTDGDGAGSPTGATAPGATTTATRPQEGTPLRVYLVRDGRIGASTRFAMATPAVGRAALTELLAGLTPPERDAGLTTEIPAGTKLERLTIENGHATAQLSNDLTPLGQAQVVFTLTQFPSVEDAVVVTPSGKTKPLDRVKLEGLSPIILVEQPAPGQTVASPLTVTGTANTFEATLQLELTDADGHVLTRTFLTATSGSGTRGTFSGKLSFTPPAAGTGLVLRAYENSAENGERIHVVKIPLVAG